MSEKKEQKLQSKNIIHVFEKIIIRKKNIMLKVFFSDFIISLLNGDFNEGHDFVRGSNFKLAPYLKNNHNSLFEC